MQQDYGNGAPRGTDGFGTEDASQAQRHVQNAEENRDALEAQSRRTEATAPSGVDQPIQGTTGGGMSGSGRASEDSSQAAAHVDEAERNRDALEEQNRRVENSTPSDLQGR
jgi:hypothetical protein